MYEPSYHTLFSPTQEAGRLVPCGVDEWVHVNCAVWSAEVYEEHSGILRCVHTAISRGARMVRARGQGSHIAIRGGGRVTAEACVVCTLLSAGGSGWH